MDYLLQLWNLNINIHECQPLVKQNTEWVVFLDLKILAEEQFDGGITNKQDHSTLCSISS